MLVAVIGGGVAGLAAALEVTRLRPDVDVVVFEQGPAVGGKLRSATLAGQLVDVGAEAMLARRPEGLELIDAAGLGASRVSPLTSSARVWSPGGLRAIPTGTVMGVPGDLDAARSSGLFSDTTLARMAAEEHADFAPVTEDIAVGRLVGERFGPEVVDRLVDPLLGGVYAGRADRLSLQATVPALAQALTGGGSLVRAARRATGGSARPSAPSTPAPSTPAPSTGAPSTAAPSTGAPAPVFASVLGGLGRVPAAVVARGSFTVRTSTAVRAVRRTPTGFVLAVGPRPDAREVEADAVIVATPAAKAAVLLAQLAPAAATELAGIETASVAIVSIAVATGDGLVLPPGSGLLVPAGAPSLVKGVTISSQKWPGAPDGVAFIRASIGRFGDEAVLQQDDAELLRRATSDLELLLGTAILPIDALVTRWGGALPQYEVGHVERVARIRGAVGAVPGLAVAGASYDGVGIPACIQTGRLAAEQALRPLVARGSDGSGQ